MAHIVIDENRCKSCYLCIAACPKGLIKKSSHVNKLGEYAVEFCDKNNECIGCAMCAMRCPDLAITEVHK